MDACQAAINRLDVMIGVVTLGAVVIAVCLTIAILRGQRG